MKKFTVHKSLGRFKKIYLPGEMGIPSGLYDVVNEKPDCSGIMYPLPSRKKDYTCCVKTEKALWLGAPNGLTRYDADAQYEYDTVMYFSAPRELADNNVLKIYCDDPVNESIWMLTDTGVAHIWLREISAEEKSDILIDETKKYVERHGMISQRGLCFPRELSSREPFGECDNSGLFTCSFAIGEMCRYAVMKKEHGENDPRTIQAKAYATRAVEAALLLMYISGRGDGFVARTYLTTAEPVPNGGFFYRKTGGKAVCLPNNSAKENGLAGLEIDASVPVPDRLAHLYREEGFTDDDIIYKADTSSDEITGHFTNLWFAHNILGKDDPELDELIVRAAKGTLKHIIDHGYNLYDCTGRPTMWAKWSLDYFATPLGWSDGCLNACQVLMYHKLVMDMTGEEGIWKESYDRLMSLGYADLTAKHDARFHVSSKMDGGKEPWEELMYGDHTLATLAYGMIIHLEKDPVLKAKYQEGFRGWNATFRREHNPLYDIVFMYSCPEDEIDTDKLECWFRRCDVTRLGSQPTLMGRYDLPVRTLFSGMKEFSWLLTSDEYAVSKHDRNPFEAQDDDISGRTTRYLENAYLYTLPYWLGRYFGIIGTEEN